MGRRTIDLPDGSRYLGEVNGEGVPHGRGARTWPNGSSYKGGFRDGQPNGQGARTWPDGSSYEGGFRDGQPHGRGARTWPDGSSYEGGFRDGQPHGQGVLETTDGRLYEGEWIEGSPLQGVLEWPDGRRYEGFIGAGGKPYGHGNETWPDGRRYEGAWKVGRPHGHGVMTWPDGARLAAGLASALGFTSVAIAADATFYGSVRSGIYHLGSEGETKASWDLGSVDAGDLGGSGDKLWSRIGVRASYDLGNGMTSGLHIEKRLDSFRTRHQNVWLGGGFGRLTLGQQGTPFHSAVSWDGTNLFGNWNTSPHGGSRGQGIQYSSMLDGPFNFAAMIRDDNSNGNGSGAGFDQYEFTVTYSVADVATISAGYLGDYRDPNEGGEEQDVYGGSVGGSTAGFSWDLGYEKTSETNDKTNYGAFVGYGGAYVFYEDLNSENNMGENHYIVLGYSRSLGTNTRAIVEVQVPDKGQNRTAVALRVDF